MTFSTLRQRLAQTHETDPELEAWARRVLAPSRECDPALEFTERLHRRVLARYDAVVGAAADQAHREGDAGGRGAGIP